MAVDRIDEADERVKIAGRIKVRRAALQLTQEQVATRAEISKSFMSELEAGTTTANGLIYVRLSRVLECDVQHLLVGHDESYPTNEATKAEALESIANSLEALVDIAADFRSWLWRKG